MRIIQNINIRYGSGVPVPVTFGCISLSTIKIPNTVTKIGDYAFSECHSLKSIVIGSNVASIGYKFFSHCHKLKSVTCYASKVPATNHEVFDDTPKSNVRLAVNEAAIDDYKKDETWNKFDLWVILQDRMWPNPL